jgi:WD40 repeat protein
LRTSVCWRKTAPLSEVHVFDLEHLGQPVREYDYDTVLDIHLSFSPDSRRLAVVSRYRIVILDLSSGTDRCLFSNEDGGVSSFTWVDKDNAAYVVHKDISAHPLPDDPWLALRQFASRREFFRCDLTASTSRPQLLYEEGPAVRFSGLFGLHSESWVNREWWPTEWWSPGGQYVLYSTGGDALSVADKASLRLLDVGTGKAVTIRSDIASLQYVAWKHNKPEALVVLDDGPDRIDTVYLVRAPAGEIVPLQAPFNGVLKEGMVARAPMWTPDDQYVAVETPNDACLVDVASAKVIPVRTAFLSQTKSPGSTQIRIRPLGIPGWLHLHIGESEKFTPYEHGGPDYIVDYEAKKILHVGPSGDHQFAVSPDGKMVGRVGSQHWPVIAPSGLPVQGKDK